MQKLICFVLWSSVSHTSWLINNRVLEEHGRPTYCGEMSLLITAVDFILQESMTAKNVY